MGIREEFLGQVETWWATADQNAADAEKWRELDRELEERGYGRMSPGEIVGLIVPHEVVETLRDWLRAQKGRSGHSERYSGSGGPIAESLVTGVTTGAVRRNGCTWYFGMPTREDGDEGELFPTG